jgi:putative ATP-dependent endonuclease of OLD family
MKINKIKIKNFRLLHDVELRLEKGVTVVVGRNNCGKTSLSDLIRRFLADASSFDIEDFSSASYDDFCAALRAKLKGAADAEVRALIPCIELRVHIEYDDDTLFGPLEDFVIDVDDANHEAIVVCRRALKDGAVSDLFAGHDQIALDGAEEELPSDARIALLKSLRERVPGLFVTQLWAEDPADPLNTKEVAASAVKGLLSCGFINAQRGLDGTGSKGADILSKVLENLFASASLPTADGKQRDIAEGLTKAVEEIQSTIDEDFRTQLTQLMPTIKSFGYPGLDGHELRTETRLDVKRLLSDHTKVQYSGYSGVNLPEAYNGLGFRNLLFILLQIVGFYRGFRAQEHAPGLQLIFIEEPEAHLHPQMQEVFIRHLSTLAKKLCEEDGEGAQWPVQFVVSTHSSHVANEASFDAIRYFAVSSKDQPVGVRRTEIKDLSTGLAGQKPDDLAFLHQYLTLTRCDLFFADKAILIEGTSERLMVPQITRKLDAANKNLNLTSQYVTIMEVGGAYAHIFFPLLDFLNLRTLIVTDLDPVKAGKKNGKTCWKACAVHESERTSNACLKSWFKTGEADEVADEEMELVGEDEFDEDGQQQVEAVDATVEGAFGVMPTELIVSDDKKKIRGNRRIAYQVPEVAAGPCGRTFEDAFILANAAIFGVSGATADDQAVAAGKLAKRHKKSTFALTYAISNTEWTPPRYLADGLKWLAEGNLAILDPNLALVVQATAEVEAAMVAEGATIVATDDNKLEGLKQ